MENSIRASLKASNANFSYNERTEFWKEKFLLSKKHRYGIARNLEVYMQKCGLLSDRYMHRIEKTKTQRFLFSEVDINHLLVKLNLPMLCKPLTWNPKSLKDYFPFEDSWEKGAFLRLSEMSGDYLTKSTF